MLRPLSRSSRRLLAITTAVLALLGVGAAVAAEPLIAPPTGPTRTCTGRVGEKLAPFATAGPYSIAAVSGTHPAGKALSCVRARRVLIAGFKAVVAVHYYNPGTTVTVARTRYTLDFGHPVAAGGYAWVGGDTVIEFVHGQ
jgi:hypothetical protein